jgi:hypothetical protein
MVSDGIKAARVQARYSELNRTWAGTGSRAAGALSAAARAVGWNPGRDGRKRGGKHAAPGRALGRHTH